MSVSIPVPCCLDYCDFVILFEVWESYASCLYFLPQVALAILGLLWFHIHFWIICSNSVKNVMSNLIGITLNPIAEDLSSMAILTIFILLIQEHGISFHSLNHLQSPLSMFSSSQHINLLPP